MSFFDPGLELQPRDRVRVEQLEVIPYPDRYRIFVHVVVTPFEERPNLLLTARDESDAVVRELSIIETMHHDMEFTLHLPADRDPTGLYTLSATLYYETLRPPHDEAIEVFEIPPADEPSDGESGR